MLNRCFINALLNSVKKLIVEKMCVLKFYNCRFAYILDEHIPSKLDEMNNSS